MIRKVDIHELEKGMYISGFQKEGSDKGLFFMNNILVKNKKDLEDFERYGYQAAYVVVDEPLARPPVSSNDLPMETEPDLSEFDAEVTATNTEAKAEQSRTTDKKIPVKLGLVPKRDPEKKVIDPEVEELLAEEILSIDAVDIEAGHDNQAVAPVVEHTRIVESKKEDGSEQYDGSKEVEIEDLVEFDKEIEAATAIRNDAEELVRAFMSNVSMGKAIEPAKIHQTVEAVIDSTFRNQDAIASLTRLKSVDEYTFGHCINVCILSVAIARRMGFNKEALRDLGAGAMLHDVGKALVPEHILKKKGPLSEQEFDRMKKHPLLGVEYLKEMPEIKESSLHVVAQHHEKYNGTGYPAMKESERIHIFARIAAVADVYDAMTSTRCYQLGMLPDIALQKIYMLREKQFEPILVERLIKCLGIYPIGTVIELNTKEMAIVKAINHSHPLQPKISMLINANGKRFKKPFQVDLKNTASKWVVSSKDPKSIGIDIDDIIA